MGDSRRLDRGLEELTCADFAAGLNQEWTLAVPGLDIPVTLVEAEERAEALPGQSRLPFSLIFHTGEMRYPPQGTYPLRHPALGEVEVFIVPLGPKPGQPDIFRYQVVFN